jgi:hypothetical protein
MQLLIDAQQPFDAVADSGAADEMLLFTEDTPVAEDEAAEVGCNAEEIVELEIELVGSTIRISSKMVLKTFTSSVETFFEKRC